MSPSDLNHYRQSINSNLAELRLARRQANEEKRALESARQKVEDILASQKLVQEVAATIQASAHAQISKVVSRCLRTVFGDDAYQFKIDFKQARGKTEARLLFVRNDSELDPIDSTGGGCIDIASFALRLSCLMLSRPRKRRLLVLDEPFRFLSKDYRPAAKQLLVALAEETKIQLIMVTHSSELTCGKLVELE